MASTGDRAARQTYHPNGYGVSEGLLRARKPFRMANAVTGAVIAGFAVSVYFYSIRAVAQDDFSDIGAPTEEQRKGVRSIEDEKREQEQLKADRLGLPGSVKVKVQEAEEASRRLEGKVQDKAVEVKQAVQGKSKSILDLLTEGFGGKGAPSKIVYGAPPVDQIGRVGETSPLEGSRRLV